MIGLSVVGSMLLFAMPCDAFAPLARTPKAMAPKATTLGTVGNTPQEGSPTKQLKLDTPAARQKYVSFAKPRLLELLANLNSDAVVDRAHLLM